MGAKIINKRGRRVKSLNKITQEHKGKIVLFVEIMGIFLCPNKARKSCKNE